MRARLIPKLAQRGILTILAAAAGWGQEAPASNGQPAGFPLESIAIEGNDQIPMERIVAASGLTIGQLAGKAEFDQARDRLLATGAFEQIGYAYEPSSAGTGYDLLIEVAETVPLYRYRFENLPGTEAELQQILADQEPVFEDLIPPSPTVMNRYSAALGKALGIEVRSEVSSDTPGELTILFRPEGRRANISAVEFVGNQIMPTGELRRAMSEVAIGAPYSEPLFRRMLESSVRPLYEERGRIRVAFPNIAVKPSTENRGVELTVTVDEGPVYTFGRLELETTDSAISQREGAGMRDAAGWRSGDIANFTEVQAGVDRILRGFRNNGYLRAAAPVERTVHDDEQTVDLLVTVDPGPQYTMGSLTIDGLDLLSEPVIRKIWQMPEGAPYQEAYADNFIQRIRDEGVFDNLGRTGAEAEIDDASHTVHVILTFLGANVVPENERVPVGQRR